MRINTSIRHQLADIRLQITDIVAQLTSDRLPAAEAIGGTLKLGELIDSLPFATEQYAVAKNRLRNAQRYFQCDEVGAARYELRLMLGQLGKTFI